MPTILRPIDEAAPHILDPITFEVIHALIKRFGLQEYFGGDNIYINTPRHANSCSVDKNGDVNMGNNRCDVVVVESFNPDTVFWNMTNTYNNPSYGISKMYTNQYSSVIRDPLVGLNVGEMTAPCGLTMEFTMTFLTDEAARRAFISIMAQNHNTVAGDCFDLVYDYPIDFKTLEILFAVYKCRSSINTKMGFVSYLKSLSNRGKVTVDYKRPDVQQVGQPVDTQIVIKRQQLNCVGMMEFDQQNLESVRVNQLPSAFPIRFTYKIQFGRPNLLEVSLPVVVENQVVNPSLFDTSPDSNYIHLCGAFTNASFNSVARRLNGANMPSVRVIFPTYNDFQIPQSSSLYIYKYNPLVIAATTLDLPGDTVLPIAKIDTAQLHPIVVELIKQHTLGDIVGYDGLFNITVFANNVAVDPSKVAFDPVNLTFTLKARNSFKQYQYVISEATDFKRVHPKWYPTILKYRYFFPMAIMRSVDYMVRMGFYTITNDDTLVKLINQLIKTGRFDGILQDMINSKQTDASIYQYTQTANQFADYITNAPARAVGPIPLSEKLGDFLTTTYPDLQPEGDVARIIYERSEDYMSRTLFNTFVDACVSRGYLSPTNIPKSHLRTPNGYPYGPEQGGSYGFSLPLRVFNTVIQ